MPSTTSSVCEVMDLDVPLLGHKCIAAFTAQALGTSALRLTDTDPGSGGVQPPGDHGTVLIALDDVTKGVEMLVRAVPQDSVAHNASFAKALNFRNLRVKAPRGFGEGPSAKVSDVKC